MRAGTINCESTLLNILCVSIVQALLHALVNSTLIMKLDKSYSDFKK